MRFEGLPPGAIERLRESMTKFEGEKGWTCVNQNCQVMADAGFTSGNVPLDDLGSRTSYFPTSMLYHIFENGLEFDGQPVTFDVIRTTPLALQSYALEVLKAEGLTFWRHGQRALAPLLKRYRIAAFWAFARQNTQNAVNLLFTHEVKTPDEIQADDQVIGLAPGEQEFVDDITLSVSRQSKIGILLRIAWGAHNLFEARQTRIDINRYLQRQLPAFPQADPSFVTKIKQSFLFSPLVVDHIRRRLVDSYKDFTNMSEDTIFNLLAVDTPEHPNKFNIVITADRIVVARLNVRNKFVDWLLTKHVLVSGYDGDVRFAGELWRGADGKIYLNANSGTYRPTDAELESAADYLRAVFPSFTIVVVRQ